MSFPIFICEDDSPQRALMENTIFSYIALKDYDMKIVLSTGNPDELLDYIRAHPQQNSLYFLDIDLQHKINGIVLAREIREIDLTGKIIFVTTHAELSYLTFRHRIEAMDYILKDSRDDVIKRTQACIDLTYHRFQQSISESKHFQVKSSMGIQKIPIADILYFEAHHVPHKIILHTRNKRVEFRSSLKEIAKASAHFFSCHKSYVVNTGNIVRISRIGATGEAEMINGSIIPVSKACISSLSKMLKT